MAVGMTKLSSSQQQMVNKIIDAGKKAGAPDVVIQAALNIANAESSFSTNHRATRTRIREFQELGLVEVVDSEDDARTKRVVPTDKFVARLNHHLHLLKQLCDARYLMVVKS